MLKDDEETRKVFRLGGAPITPPVKGRHDWALVALALVGIVALAGTFAWYTVQP